MIATVTAFLVIGNAPHIVFIRVLSMLSPGSIIVGGLSGMMRDDEGLNLRRFSETWKLPESLQTETEKDT